MKQIFVVLLLLCIGMGSCKNTEKSDNDKKSKKESSEKPKEVAPKENYKVQEIGDSSLIFGEWKIVGIAGKAVPEDRKDVSATFKPDGGFERRLSPSQKPDIGTWSIEIIDGKKFLKLYTAAGKEDNQLIKLTKDELIFINFRKSVRLKKVK